MLQVARLKGKFNLPCSAANENNIAMTLCPEGRQDGLNCTQRAPEVDLHLVADFLFANTRQQPKRTISQYMGDYLASSTPPMKA